MSSLSSSNIERMYAPIEVAALVKVDVKTVQGWLRNPDHPLTGTKIGTMWRVKESDLRNFLNGEKT